MYHSQKVLGKLAVQSLKLSLRVRTVHFLVSFVHLHFFFFCSYEFLYEDNDSQNALERSLGIQLQKKYRNKASGVVTLIFRLIFSPYKPFK